MAESLESPDAPLEKSLAEPLRCPKCLALVVDRRFSSCTTCHEPLPPEWVLSPAQIDKLEAIDRAARAEHAAAIETLEPGEENNPLTDVQGDVT